MSEVKSDIKIWNPIIDIIGFNVGNYIAHKVTTSAPAPSWSKSIIFGVSDALVRNKLITVLKEQDLFNYKMGGNFNENAYIAVFSLIGGSIYDLIKGKSFGKLIADNLIINAIGFSTNEAVDRLIPAQLM